jgi:hypothetical protein
MVRVSLPLISFSLLRIAERYPYVNGLSVIALSSFFSHDTKSKQNINGRMKNNTKEYLTDIALR